MTIDSPNQWATKTCTYLKAELRKPLYSVLWMLDQAPNSHIAQLANSIIILQSRPRPQAQSLAVALQFYMGHHEDG